jgi:hypothetical protein
VKDEAEEALSFGVQAGSLLLGCSIPVAAIIVVFATAIKLARWILQ